MKKTNYLYIVATPIGNMEDISLRALRILGEVNFILCEDTRVTKKLLDKYKIKTPTISFHEHSDEKKINYILDLLKQGNNLAMVSDAGTPGISDPGGKLVQAVIENLNKNEERVKIEAIPGPSALTAALSISGIPTDRFLFLGFPPHKKGRQAFLQKIINSEEPVVVYESKHRIIKFLEELEKINAEIKKENEKIDKMDKYFIKKNDVKKRKVKNSVVLCRELSKMHETVYRGELLEILNKIKSNQNEQKGEFVVIIA